MIETHPVILLAVMVIAFLSVSWTWHTLCHFRDFTYVLPSAWDTLSSSPTPTLPSLKETNHSSSSGNVLVFGSVSHSSTLHLFSICLINDRFMAIAPRLSPVPNTKLIFNKYLIHTLRQRNQKSNCQHPWDHRKTKGIREKHLLH